MPRSRTSSRQRSSRPRNPAALSGGLVQSSCCPPQRTTRSVLSNSAWAPSVVALAQPGQWTVGALYNQIWSVSGANDRDDANSLFLQPFLNYNLGGGLSAGVSVEATANREADEEWTAPLLFNISKVTLLGKRPVSFAFAAGPHIASPAAWCARAECRPLLAYQARTTVHWLQVDSCRPRQHAARHNPATLRTAGGVVRSDPEAAGYRPGEVNETLKQEGNTRPEAGAPRDFLRNALRNFLCSADKASVSASPRFRGWVVAVTGDSSLGLRVFL
jgi:hypothetical protein